MDHFLLCSCAGDSFNFPVNGSYTLGILNIYRKCHGSLSAFLIIDCQIELENVPYIRSCEYGWKCVIMIMNAQWTHLLALHKSFFWTPVLFTHTGRPRYSLYSHFLCLTFTVQNIYEHSLTLLSYLSADEQSFSVIRFKWGVAWL